jgi:hypothetical protein
MNNGTLVPKSYASLQSSRNRFNKYRGPTKHCGIGALCCSCNDPGRDFLLENFLSILQAMSFGVCSFFYITDPLDYDPA